MSIFPLSSAAKITTSPRVNPLPVLSDIASAKIYVAPKPDFEKEILIPLKAEQAEAQKKAEQAATVVANPPAVAVTPTPPAMPSQVLGSPGAWAAAAGISAGDFGFVDFIVSHEGSWGGVTRWNGQGSGAYGLCQALPGSKMASAGSDWATNPVTQLRWCNSYAIGRYGSWAGAYNFWRGHSWW